MDKSPESLRRDLTSLLGETMAVQNILAQLIVNLTTSGVVPASLVKQVFDQADLMAETSAIRMGDKGDPIHTAKHIEVIKALRAICVRE